MGEMGQIFDELYEVVLDRERNPLDGSYTNYLLDMGIDKICKKIGEESSEVIIAAKNGDRTVLTAEIADLFYHIAVLMGKVKLTPEEVYTELARRRK